MAHPTTIPARSLQHMDDLLAADNYEGLLQERSVFAALAAEALVEGDMDLAHLYAASSVAARERRDQLLRARELRRPAEVTEELMARDI